MMEPSIEVGRQQRDIGAALALLNAGESWHEQAYRIAKQRFKEAGHIGCLFEDVRVAAEASGLAKPPSPNAWGAVCLSLSKKGLIVRTGQYGASRMSSSHARSQAFWRWNEREAS